MIDFDQICSFPAFGCRQKKTTRKSPEKIPAVTAAPAVSAYLSSPAVPPGA